MGNLITANRLGPGVYLQLSNGATAVLQSVLLLAGSDLAQTPWEIDFMRFLADRDQDIFGLGMVGFDLADIAWSSADFAQQKNFVLHVIDRAQARHRWDTLTYDPPFVSNSLDGLRSLLQRWCVDHIVEHATWDLWAPTELPSKCPQHVVYLNAQGCLICHDAPG